MPVKGRGARQKGSRAEIKVRNMLRGLYPKKLRDNVYRVPLSGAGAVKGDVIDNNDPDSVYEVKCQEKLVLHDWWRQAKAQAGSIKTPILVITQNYRPFYFLMRFEDWEATRNATGFAEFDECSEMTTSGLMDAIAQVGQYAVGELCLDSDRVVIIPQDFYLAVKGWQIDDKYAKIDTEPKG